MRHTVHLLLGEELSLIAPLLKQYTLMYGEGDAPEYLQVLSCTAGRQAPELTLQCHIHERPREERVFSSGLENRYRLGIDHRETVTSEADLQQYFLSLFNRSVTIEDPGADGQMNLCLYLPLYDRELWQMAQRIIQAIAATERRFRVDVLGLPSQMSLLLCADDEQRKRIPDQLKELKSLTTQLCGEIIAAQGLHRLMIFEDCNSSGLALNLDRDSLVRVCGEFALLYVERYEVLFPTSQMGSKIDVTSFGLSLLAFDKIYFVHYLLRKSYLYILGRERVDEREKVNVNHAAEVAQQMLEQHVCLYQQFVKDEVEPLVAQHNTSRDLNLSDTQRLEAQLQHRIDAAIEDMQRFINDPDLSLPEKQAIMAQLLGEDDPLVDGVQYFKEQLTLDDCDAETLNYFIDEDNKQVKVIPSDEVGGEPVVERGVLSAPIGEDEHVFLPLKDMKLLRARIRQRTTFIRKKNEELDSICQQLEGGETIVKRLVDGGFQFGDEIFKLLPSEQEARLFRDTYEPREHSQRNVDLREHFTPVKSQGGLGACSAFALVSIFEHIIKKSDPSNPDLSERFAYYNAVKRAASAKGEGIADGGSSFYDVVTSLSEEGLATEALCPYTATLEAPSPEAYADALSRLVKVAKNVPVNHKALTSALAEGYPVAIALKLFDSFQADSNGFVYRPSDHEILSGDTGSHAMVLCGFSEEDKVYIVRNSWGTSFGDRGYCYIPFSYVDDPRLNLQACIITDITFEKEIRVIGHDKGKAVSFNLTDDNIRAAILRILIDEEKIALSADKKDYAKLRYAYEQLLQTLTNPTKRDEIYENAVTSLKKQIDDRRADYREFVEQTRPARLREFNRETRNVLIYTAGAALAEAICLYPFWKFELPQVFLYTFIVLCLTVLFGVLYWWYRIYKKSMLRKALEDEAAHINSHINHLCSELNEKHLRMHMAGKVVSSMTDTKIRLVNKYHALVSYIQGLTDWMHEEQDKLCEMIVPNRTPCIPLLQNEILDRYFEERKDVITKDIHLTDLIGSQGMTDDDILTFKLQLRDRLINLLEREYDSFSMVEYLTGKTQYPYLETIGERTAELMPQMDRHSDCFLHILQTGVSSDDTLEKTVFIHTDKQADRNNWRDQYRKYFSQQPGDGELDSRYKLIELQIQNLQASQVSILAR